MLVSIVVVDGKPMERKMLVCFLLFWWWNKFLFFVLKLLLYTEVGVIQEPCVLLLSSLRWKNISAR
jgi:hypothetical protein